jgi:hypothetical protein
MDQRRGDQGRGAGGVSEASKKARSLGTINHLEFLELLTGEFPELTHQIRDKDGLLHLEVAAFRRATEDAMDAGNLWTVEKHFRFVARVLADASPDVENALSVSYLEDLALGECTPARHRAVKDRMPRKLRDDMIGINSKWR